MAEIKGWSNTAASNSSPSPNGWPELMERSGVNDSGREMMKDLKDYYDSPSWRQPQEGMTLIRLSSTQFRIVNSGSKTDASQWFLVNQMAKIVDDNGDVWIGHVTSSSYSVPNTTLDFFWQVDVSQDATGPLGGGSPFELYAWFESGNIVFRNTGTSTEQVPRIDDLDPHVLLAESAMDVGKVGGYTAAELISASSGNLLNNGNMGIWQRETDFSDPLEGNVVADCWSLLSDDAASTSRAIVSRSTDTPSAATDERFSYSMKIEVQNVTSPSLKSGVIGMVEERDGFHVASSGADVNVSAALWAKSSGGLNFARMYLVNAKTGTPTVSPVDDYDSGTQDVDVVIDTSEWELVASERITLTTTWTYFDPANLQDVAMDLSGAGSGAFGLMIIMDDTTFGDGDSLFITGAQVAIGAASFPYRPKPHAVEVHNCQRYYENTYDSEGDRFPGDVGSDESLNTFVDQDAQADVTWRFAVPKFKAPTVTLHPADGIAVAGEWTNGTVGYAGTASSDRESCRIVLDSGSTWGPDTASIEAEASANVWGNT